LPSRSRYGTARARGARELAEDPCPIRRRLDARARSARAALTSSSSRRTGVRLVPFSARTLEILEHDEKGYRVFDVFSGDAKVRAAPFDAIELELALLWAR
jgi:hypothetical protein